MSNDTYFFLDGYVEIDEYEAPYSPILLAKIHMWCHASSRAGYAENYQERDDDNSSLFYLFRTGQIPRFYICWVGGEFAFFSGVRVVDEDYMMLGVRTLSNRRRKGMLPYHTAYVIPLQMAYAKLAGYRKCFVSYNVGSRTGFYKSILRLQAKEAKDPVTQLAKDTALLFADMGIKHINHVDQHVMEASLI